MSKNILIVAVCLVIAVLGFYYVTNKNSASPQNNTVSNAITAQNPEKSPAPTPVSNTNTAPTTYNITIKGFAFSQPEITVKKGDTVTWTNMDSAPHTITSGNGGLTSPTIKTGEAYSFTFNDTGLFSYHCSFHPSMKGAVIVTQ